MTKTADPHRQYIYYSIYHSSFTALIQINAMKVARWIMLPTLSKARPRETPRVSFCGTFYLCLLIN
jgi:hypothetical protein